jgi:hypothetical protein
MLDTSGASNSEELLASIKRLTRIVLDKLEEGSNERTLDQAQTRLYSSIVMRSIGLWQEALNPRPRRRLRQDLEEVESKLTSLEDGKRGD